MYQALNLGIKPSESVNDMPSNLIIPVNSKESDNFEH